MDGRMDGERDLLFIVECNSYLQFCCCFFTLEPVVSRPVVIRTSVRFMLVVCGCQTPIGNTFYAKDIPGDASALRPLVAADIIINAFKKKRIKMYSEAAINHFHRHITQNSNYQCCDRYQDNY